jgi:hypothetical protein
MHTSCRPTHCRTISERQGPYLPRTVPLLFTYVSTSPLYPISRNIASLSWAMKEIDYVIFHWCRKNKWALSAPVCEPFQCTSHWNTFFLDREQDTIFFSALWALYARAKTKGAECPHCTILMIWQFSERKMEGLQCSITPWDSGHSGRKWCSIGLKFGI